MFISYTAEVKSELDPTISGGGAAPIELNLTRRSLESLSTEWDRQSRDLARRFAEKLALSREDYRRTLPEFGPKPESFKNLDIAAIPVLVDPRVAWSDLLASDKERAESGQRSQRKLDFSHLRINPMFDLQELEDWKEGGIQTPNEPYATWLTYRPNKSVKEVRAVLRRSKNIRGGMVFDVVYLYYNKPQIFNNLKINLPGSQLGPDYAPFFSALGSAEGTGRPNHPSLNIGSIDTRHPTYACLIASK